MSKGSKDADPGYKGKGHEHGADQQVETDSRAKGKTKAGGKDCGKGDANQQAESDSRAKGKTKAGGKDYGKGDATSTMGSADQQVETDSSAKGKTNAGGKDYGKGDANQQAESDSRAKGKTKAGGKDYGKYYKGKKGKSKDDDGKTGMKGKRKADQGAEAIWFHHKVVFIDDDDNDDLSFSFSYRPPREIFVESYASFQTASHFAKSYPHLLRILIIPKKTAPDFAWRRAPWRRIDRNSSVKEANSRWGELPLTLNRIKNLKISRWTDATVLCRTETWPLLRSSSLFPGVDVIEVK